MSEALLLALAELKQVKDILGGLLPAPPLEPAASPEQEKEKENNGDTWNDPLGASRN